MAGYAYYYYYGSGSIYALGSAMPVGVTYGPGDAITVTLDLNANTVAFAKNGVRIHKPVSVKHEAYYFAVSANGIGASVTIVDMK